MLCHLHSDDSIIKHRKEEKKKCAQWSLYCMSLNMCALVLQKKKKKKSNRNLSVFELKFPDLFIFVLFLHNYPWQL